MFCIVEFNHAKLLSEIKLFHILVGMLVLLGTNRNDIFTFNAMAVKILITFKRWSDGMDLILRRLEAVIHALAPYEGMNKPPKKVSFSSWMSFRLCR